MKSLKLVVGSWQLTGTLFVLLTLFLAACSEEKETLNTTDNYDYFPLAVGKYWVYEVDSIVFQNQTRRDSSKTWMKEQIVDYFVDNVGDTIYRVDQYERKTATQPWEIQRVISLLRNEKQAIRTENNISLIKMVFPLRHNTNWNSTLLIDPALMIMAGGQVEIFKYWESEIKTLDEPFADGSTTYKETATIFHAQKDVGIENRFAKEIYAKEIGLLFREWQIMDCGLQNCFASPWPAKAGKGFIIKQRLIEHN